MEVENPKASDTDLLLARDNWLSSYGTCSEEAKVDTPSRGKYRFRFWTVCCSCMVAIQTWFSYVRICHWIHGPGVGGKSVRQADVSGGTHFPRKFCPTGQDILSAPRIMCPGLGGKYVRQENVSGPDPIIFLA